MIISLDAGKGLARGVELEHSVKRRREAHDDVADSALLPDELARSLEQTVREKRGAIGPVKAEEDSDEEEEVQGHGHGHAKPPSLISALASGLVNYLLMFGLCCAYGMIMFDGVNAQHSALGVKMNLCTAWVVGLSLALFCNIRVAIGGPDLNPVVFIGDFVTTMAADISAQLDLDSPPSRRLAGAPSGDKAEWCSGAHLEANLGACLEYHEQLRATTVFAVAASSAALGLLFFLSGRFNFTRYASYVPTCVMEAFLSCVGYKVFNYALYFSKYDAKQFIPAAMIGVPMYFIKVYRVGNPAVVIPLVLLIPLAIFYIGVFATGKDLQHETIQEWMFPQMDNVPFWAVWEWSIGNPSKINFQAWAKTLPLLAVMLVVCFIDCLLKVLGTEGKLPVKVDKDQEMQLFGGSNLITALSGSSVGYMQLKFNVINAGILGNIQDRRGGLAYAALCAITWFWTIEHFNFLPRFFLSTLLFFAGAGFVSENLWGSRKYLSLGEWFQIVTILAVFILAQDLLYAVLVGVLLTCADFILTYARVPCVVEPPTRRAELSCVRREPIVQRTLDHVLNKWLLVVRLKGFVFFASAQTLVAQIRGMMDAEERDGVPQYRRLRFVIFDCTHMDGMDASTAKILRKLKSEAANHRIAILWTHVDAALEKRLRKQELVTDSQQTFADTDEALHSIEDHILSYQASIHDRWVKLHPTFALQKRFAVARAAFEPFSDVFADGSFRRGCPWRYCHRVEVKQYSTLLWTPGKMDVGLFLVHSGSVALFRELPNLAGTSPASWPSPIAVYTPGWFLNRESLLVQPTRHYAVALEDGELVMWTRDEWKLMGRETPHMAFEIAKAVMKQQASDAEHTDRNRKDNFLPETMQHKLSAIREARALGRFEMYEALPAGSQSHLPPMPPTLQHDVRTAFATFCDAQPAQPARPGDAQAEGEDGTSARTRSGSTLCNDAQPVLGDARVPTDRVADALMFAGIFNASPPLPPGGQGLSMEEFFDAAHEAAMLRLSSAQVDKLTKCFEEFDEDSSGMLELDVLGDTLTTVFSHKLDSEELEALISEWAEDTKRLDVTKFIALTSRLARIREQDWQLLQGIEEVMRQGSPEKNISMTTSLSVGALMAAAPDLTEERAEEMLWVADWRTGGRGCGKFVGFCDFVCAVLQPPMRKAGRLPPRPREHHIDMREHKAPCARVEEIEKRAEAESRRVQSALSHFDDPKLLFAGMVETDKSVPQEAEEPGPPTWRQRLHLLLEDPTSSVAAQVLWLIMGLCLLVSLLVMFIQPIVALGSWRQPKAWAAEGEAFVWWCFEAVVTVVFTVEYLLRLSVANAMRTRTTIGFVVEPSNLCDMLAILPFYIELLVSDRTSIGYLMLRVVRLLRLTRIARISRLARKHSLFGPVSMVMLVIWFIYLKTAVIRRESS